MDLVVGPDAYRNLPELIGLAGQASGSSDTEFRRWEHYEDVPPVREKSPTAFVTVQRGCDYRCTFCIVPYTRGPERSRRLEDVVREVAALAAGGTTEVTLLGQTVNSYHDGQHDFADLLRAVGAVDGIRRLRFTSPYPTEFTPRVIEAMAIDAGRVRARAPAGAERVERGAPPHAPPLHPRALPRGGGAAPVGHPRHHLLDRHHRRLPRRDRGAVRGDAEPRRRCRFRRRLHLQVLGPRGHAGGAPAGPRAGRGRVRPAASGSSRLSDARRAPEERRASGQVHEVLVERPARRGGLMLGTHPQRTSWYCLTSRHRAVGEYHTVRLTGTTGSTFTGAIAQPSLAVL